MRNPIDRTWSAARHVFSRVLFSVGLNFQTDLDNGNISEYIRYSFKTRGLTLPRQVTVSTLEEDSKWLITDTKNKLTYSVLKEESGLNFYISTTDNRKLIVEGKFEEVDDSEVYAYCRTEHIRKLADYLTILDNWLSVFPPEQLYISFFEDIANRPRELLSEIFAHIGVSGDVDWNDFPFDHVINKGASVPMPPKYRNFLEEMHSKDIDALYERFGDPIAGWRCS